MHIAAAKPRRAHRYEIRTDVRFRPAVVQNWQFGETENISDTGLLVRAIDELPVNTPIQFELYAPAPISGVAQLPLTCSGRVVRTDRDGERGGIRLAIAVQEAHLQPATSPSTSIQDSRLVNAFHALNNQLMVLVGTAELLLAENHLDDVAVSRVRKMKDVTLEAATTVKKLLT